MKSRSIQSLATAVALAGAMASTANGAITYVDASEANTTGSTLTGTPNVYTDNIWSLRVSGGVANGGNIYEAGPTPVDSFPGETVPTLVQTVSGLTAGTYDVYVYFWVAHNVRWGISAGLTGSPLVTATGAFPQDTPVAFEGAGAASTIAITAANLTDGTFTSASAPTLTNVGDRFLAQLHVGTVEIASGTGTLSVSVSSQPALTAAAANSRTWFDGIGYAPVTIPEPTTTLLAGLGALAMLRRRR